MKTLKRYNVFFNSGIENIQGSWYRVKQTNDFISILTGKIRSLELDLKTRDARIDTINRINSKYKYDLSLQDKYYTMSKRSLHTWRILFFLVLILSLIFNITRWINIYG